MRGVLFFVLTIILIVGCAPTERIVVRMEKDSSEISVLQGKIKEMTSENSALQSDVKMWRERSFSLVEELNRSERERERLATNEERTVREWGEGGALLREEVLRKTSEMESDLVRSERVISSLEERSRRMEQRYATLRRNYDTVVRQNGELRKKTVTAVEELRREKERRRGGGVVLLWVLLVATNGAWVWIAVRRWIGR